jgi:hypothetical protein
MSIEITPRFIIDFVESQPNDTEWDAADAVN